MNTAIITVKIKNIPEMSDEDTIKYLEKYFYTLAGSNDGSEFLANLTLNNSTVDIIRNGEKR